MNNSLLLSQALTQVGSGFQFMFQLITGVLGKSPPSNPRNKKESAPWDEHGGGNGGSLGLQWKNNMGERVEKDLSLHGRKGHFTEGGEKAHTDELGIKLYPLENVPASLPTARIFCTSLSIYHGSTLNGSMIFLMGERVSILRITSSATKTAVTCAAQMPVLGKMPGPVLAILF